jgi:hypothetical protein
MTVSLDLHIDLHMAFTVTPLQLQIAVITDISLHASAQVPVVIHGRGTTLKNLLCAYGFKIFPTSYRDHEFQRVEGMVSTTQYICKGTGHGFNSSKYL